MSKWNEALSAIFPVRGWFLSKYRLSQPADADFDEHQIQLWKGGGTQDIVLYTPRPASGVYEVDGTYKVLIHSGVPGADYCRSPRSSSAVKVYTKEEILAQALRRALAKGLFEKVDQDRMQSDLDAFFGSSPLLRQVNPWNPLQVRMTKDLVHIDLGRSLRAKDRLVRDWAGKVDLLTTPQGDRILQTYQMARGAGVNDVGRLAQGKSPFSVGMESCLSFPENTRPNRLLAARAALEYRETLVGGDQPMIVHHRYEEHDLYGVHLLTAIMAHPMNFEDCVVVSPQAAARMRCYKYKLFTLSDVLDVQPAVSIGDRVEEGSTLIRAMDKEEVIRSVRLDDPLYKEVFMVECCKTRVAGKQGGKAKIVVFGTLELEDGSKITHRAGGKATVRVVHDLPLTKDGKRIDIMVHPKSIAKRRCYGMLREMALGRWCEAEGKRVTVKHFDDKCSLENLAKSPWGQPTEMEDGSMVFVGPLYWLRTDKHARDALSWTGDEKPVDSRGLNPDSSKAGGQRFGQDMQMVLQAKGLGDVAEHLCRINTEPQAESLVRRLAEALLGVEET